MYEIRKIPKSDIPQVLEIYAQGVEGGHSTFNTEVPTAESWDKSHLEICRIGAYDGDLLLGWRAIQPTSTRECYKGVVEVSLYVRSGCQNKGVGSGIMARLVKESESLGIWTLYRAIFDTNKGSIRMCEKNGWRIVGKRENIAKNKFGLWQSTVIMERRSKTVGVD